MAEWEKVILSLIKLMQVKKIENDILITQRGQYFCPRKVNLNVLIHR